MKGVAEKVMGELDKRGLVGNYNYGIQGGYFEWPEGPNEFSRNTAGAASRLAYLLKTETGGCAERAILVNDLGMVCDASACQMTSATSEGDLANAIAEVTGSLSENHAWQVIRERSLRNKGLRTLKPRMKRVKQGLEDPSLILSREGNGMCWSLRDRGTSPIQLASEREGRTSAKCPLLMGTLYYWMAQMIHEKKEEERETTILLDFAAYPEKDRVSAGTEVFFNIWGEIQRHWVVPVFCNRYGEDPVVFVYEGWK